MNLRPALLLRSLKSPLAESSDLDIKVVQERVFTRCGVARIMRYAFEEAKTRCELIVGATKNGISATIPFFDEIFRELAEEYLAIEAPVMRADALATQLVLNLGRFDVAVGSNLCGDFLLGGDGGHSQGHRHRALGQPQHQRTVPLPRRAHPRLYFGHNRQGDREPHRRDLGRRLHAGARRIP